MKNYITVLFFFISKAFGYNRKIPIEHYNNFKNLFLDVTWFGLLNGSTLTFLSIYAARLGSTSFELGLITASPAIVALLFALPFSSLFQNKSISKTVFFSSVINRIFYAILIAIPVLLPPRIQISTIVVIIFMMSIPGTALNIGFNALLGCSVPIDWRGEVAGTRNALLALSTTISTLLCGILLNSLPFILGYQVVFFLGFLGAMMSSLHLSRIHPIEDILPPQKNHSNRFNLNQILRLDILSGNFAKELSLISLFHLTMYLAVPIFPIFLVNVLHFTDQTISIGSSLFFIAVFLGSTQLAGLTRKFGTRSILGVGAIMMGIYPFLLTFSRIEYVYFFVNTLGGIAWSLSGGLLYNYFLEKSPEYDRPGYLAWFNLGSNAAILIGSIAGALIGREIGLVFALLLFAILRSLVGTAILKWG